ncbi:unnamed protein product [Dibothriocephalus latus]|uniref:Uncharacterized protein n=1 Tax=Dibothriocephalus latus TaxID=60516 RepID=A0A3P7LXJ8_DIBLA|nr:unnamed protein product [Dibothriocephalus latus]
MLLRKLGTRMHELYTDIILPNHPRDFTFDETLQRLSETFGEKSSLFNTRYQCFKLYRQPRVRKVQFKCFIFVSALRSPCDAETRARLLYKIEQDPDSTLQTLTAECQA